MLLLRKEKEKSYTNQQVTTSITTGSKPTQPSVQTGALPIHRRGPTRDSGHPHLVRWWSSTAMVGALTPRMLIVVTVPGHHEQGGRVSFEIRGGEGHCSSDSLKIEMAE
jgi:hypothetical protein